MLERLKLLLILQAVLWGRRPGRQILLSSLFAVNVRPRLKNHQMSYVKVPSSAIG